MMTVCFLSSRGLLEPAEATISMVFYSFCRELGKLFLRVFWLQQVAQARRIVGDNPVYTEGEQPLHLAHVVHSPHKHLEAELMGCLDRLFADQGHASVFTWDL